MFKDSRVNKRGFLKDLCLNDSRINKWGFLKDLCLKDSRINKRGFLKHLCLRIQGLISVNFAQDLNVNGSGLLKEFFWRTETSISLDLKKKKILKDSKVIKRGFLKVILRTKRTTDLDFEGILWRTQRFKESWIFEGFFSWTQRF